MPRKSVLNWTILGLALTLVGLIGFSNSSDRTFSRAAFAQEDTPPPTPEQEQPEVMTRGPVHEAYAEPVNIDNQPGVLASAEPPADVNETPPSQRPAAGRHVWIPGYWAWDSDRNEYIWISGCWRVAPPKMYWVPGYWARSSGGWEWIAGFWAPRGDDEIDYLADAPPDVVYEPVGPPPSTDHVWVPPCYYYRDGRYVLRSGYWLGSQTGWIWVPSHYVRTPRGHVFVAGCWDYPFETRGVIFAPVYYRRHTHVHVYSPSVVVDIGILRIGLFTYPRYSHYYFGDYYDDAYVRVGIYPWFEVRNSHRWCDPIYDHHRWEGRRHDDRWDDHERRDYDDRRANQDRRPPRTYREMETRLAKAPESRRRDLEIARPLAVAAQDKDGPMKFEKVDDSARQNMGKQANDVQKFRQDRTRWEARSDAKDKDGEDKQPVTPPRQDRQGTPTPRTNTGPPTGERERGQPTPPERTNTAPSTGERDRNQPTQPERTNTGPPTGERERTQPTQPATPPDRTGPSAADRERNAPPDRSNTGPPTGERERTQPAQPATPPDRAGPSATDRERNAPPDRSPSGPPTGERDRSSAPSSDRPATAPTPQPSERSRDAAPAERKDASPTPRDDRARPPERVRIPSPPVGDSDGDRAQPARPSDEDRRGSNDDRRSGGSERSSGNSRRSDDDRH